jgi:cell division protein ZipA
MRSPGTDRDAGSRAKTPTLHASSAAPPAAAAAAAAAAHSAGSAIRATSAQFAAAPEPASTARPAPPAPPAPSVAPALVAPISVAPSPAAVPAAPAAPAAPEVKANASESQRVVTIRVAAQSDALWDGSTLLAALEKHGLGFGRYKVFHRKHVDGRTLFCVASLVEPGTFDLPKMPEQEFRGLTLFAVLPGPLDAMQSVDMLVTTAGELAATLHGVVQDSQGAPLTAERALELRDEVARFQASLVT